jgi:hypothetical protein
MVLTDLDGTFASADIQPSAQELSDRAEARRLLDEQGYVAGVVTARTPALTMSHNAYQASKELGFDEEEPHWGRKDGKRCYEPLENVSFFAHCLDWDVVLGFGAGIFPRNGHGYLVDDEYDLILNYDYSAENPKVRRQIREFVRGTIKGLEEGGLLPWREAAMLFLLEAWPQARHHLAEIESLPNYKNGETDVAPLKYRIQLNFNAGNGGVAKLRELKDAIYRYQVDPQFLTRIAMRMELVDESKPSEVVEQSKYTLYLVPKAACKERMINRYLRQSCAAAGLDPKDVRLFYAGDTPTDLCAGLYAGTNTTFLLASGSRLAPFITGRSMAFGEESLDFLWDSSNRPEPRLVSTGRTGEYKFVIRGRPWANTVVIGDERYPGTPTRSVLEFLREYALNASH